MKYKSDIPEELSVYERSYFVVVPCPYEKTTSYGKGTKDGPKGICEASSQVELFDEELGRETFQLGINTTKPVSDLDKLEDAVLKIASDKKFPIVLGGEHTISAAPVRALKKIYPDLSVVHFDAHADLRDEYEGTKLSHACVLRRIYDAKVSFVQIGIRSHSIEEFEFIKTSGINKPYYAFEIQNSFDWMDEAISKLSNNVYLTFDVDAFDPNVVSATGTPEPGGLDWYQVTTFFKKLVDSKKVVGADFVELAPKAGDPSSDFNVAKLIYKLIGYVTTRKS